MNRNPRTRVVSPHAHFFQALSMAVPLGLALAAAYGSIAQANKEGAGVINRIEQQQAEAARARNPGSAAAARAAEIVTGESVTTIRETTQVACNGDSCVTVPLSE